MLGREQLSNEVSSEHKHIWAATGCWCGATRCTFQIPRPEPPSGEAPRGVRPYHGQPVAVKTDRCKATAVAGSDFCHAHPPRPV